MIIFLDYFARILTLSHEHEMTISSGEESWKSFVSICSCAFLNSIQYCKHRTTKPMTVLKKAEGIRVLVLLMLLKLS